MGAKAEEEIGTLEALNVYPKGCRYALLVGIVMPAVLHEGPSQEGNRIRSHCTSVEWCKSVPKTVHGSMGKGPEGKGRSVGLGSGPICLTLLPGCWRPEMEYVCS